ncbi:MAG: phosphoadenylyl-sulfate reductase [Hyphomicrobiales bacterium]|nr:phosphoadenylyl-sulfate reductase [Hyphomicrobiales bacterium]
MAPAAADHDALAARLDADFAALDAPGRLRALRAGVEGRIVFTTSFGLEDQAIAHMIAEAGLDIALVTLDTGRMFPETYEVWRETERRLGVRIAAYCPDGAALEALVERQGIDGFYESVPNRHACCDVRKVAPLARALSGASAWATGLRASQSLHRTGMGFASFDAGRSLIKANPLLDWSREDVAAYCARHGAPVNALHARGFPSIGCAPCTRAVQPGEDERAGRWWWETSDQANDKECGLHVGADGRLVRAVKAEGLADR